MKHIYLINNSNSPAFKYGVGTYVQQLQRCLEGHEVNLTVINLDNQREKFEVSAEKNIRTICIPSPHSSLAKNKYARALRYIGYFLTYYINKNEKNIFHFNFLQQGELADLLKALYPDCKILLTIHYLNWLMEIKGNIIKLQSILAKEKEARTFIERAIYDEYYQDMAFLKRADQVICLSRYTESLFRRQLGITPEKMEVIYNGLEDTDFSLSEKDRHTLKSQYLLTDSEKIILFVGRVDKLKGIEYLIEAFRLVLRSVPDTRLIIVGDGDYRLCIEKSQDIWSKITFTGKIPKEKLYQFYQLAHVGVLPSLCEQCSYTAIEMMMNGLPFIGTSSTGLKEMLSDRPEDIIPLTEEADETLFPIDQLADRLINHLSGPKKSDRGMYQDRYSFIQMKTKMNHLYANL